MTKGFSPWETGQKRQLYVDVVINGKVREVLLDTGASHNFVDPSEAAILGLKVVRGGGKMKAVNSRTIEAEELVKDVLLKVGTWRGLMDVTTVPMDDYKVVLGLEFFRKANATHAPALKLLTVFDEHRIRMVPLKNKELLETKLMSHIAW